MRIIAGNFKGKKIHLPADKKTRPLRDLVKESIFNLIENSNKFNVKISNANILDLFFIALSKKDESPLPIFYSFMFSYLMLR